MTAQRGSVALLAVLAAVMVSGVALVMVAVATDYVDARGRAASAADAAALAAGSASPLVGGDGQPRGPATALAEANDAEVIGLDQAGWPHRVTIETSTAPRLGMVRAVIPSVRATAAARMVPGAPIDAEQLAAHAPPDTSGALSRPADGPISSPFGWRTHPVHGDRRLHAGVDIAAPYGSPIRAAASGIVVAAGRRGGYGLLVELDHGAGRRTRYAHASRLHVAVGDQVDRGQPIAAVGATGTVTGPHLHFELRQDGRPLDPVPRWQE